MGKTTRFHPVSLPVIRGAALKCGYQLGRIVQTHMDETYAYYRAHLLVCPELMVGASCEELAGDLNGCYAQDVTVTKAEAMRGRVWVYFRTTAMPSDWVQQPSSETGLEWLVDDHSDIPF